MSTFTRNLSRRVLLMTTLFWSWGNQAAPLLLPDFPLFLSSTGVSPNLVLTLDDSGSMRRAFVPENCNADTSDCALLDNRYEKSAYRNLIYYDPLKTYLPAKNANGSERPSSSDMSSTNNMFTTVYRNGFDTAFGTVNLSSAYQPTANLDLDGSASEAFMGHYISDVDCASSRCKYKNEAGSWVNMTSSTSCSGDSTCQSRTMPAYYYVFDNSNAGCTGTNAEKKTDNDCYDIKIVSSTSGPALIDINGDGVINASDKDERQNFANWYSFYRTRNLSSVTAASRAFATLDPTVRVAWQGLLTCTLPDTDCDGWKNNFSGKSNKINTFTGTHKNNFYDWLFQLPTYSGTPLPAAMARAGDYFSTSGVENSPYDNDFTTAGSGQHSCRKNYHLLMTDGIWTDGITVGNTDNTNKAWPAAMNDNSPTSYVAQAPYKDIYSNTLADVAFKYWSTDLVGLTNNVAPDYRDLSGSASNRNMNAKNNPATWQHMVNFTIGLGLSEHLANATYLWDGDTHSSNASTSSYPSLVAGTKLWPAAAATSDYKKSDNVVDLWHAAINSRGKFYSADDPGSLVNAFRDVLNTASSQAAAGGGAGLGANTTKIAFDSSLNSLTTVFQAKFNADWSGTLEALPVQANGTFGAAYWEAGVRIPAAASRNIFTLNGTAQSFTSCTGALATALGANCTNKLNWLRGDASQEERNGGTLRNRTFSVLGDIMSSDPIYSHKENFGYTSSGVTGASDYAAYVTVTKAARTPVVYVGANDGMLHAFNAEINPSIANRGVELFAFVPAGVYGNLSALTEPEYALSHKYLVDGPPTLGDVYNSGWKTYLIGGLGAGGKSIYALDVSTTSTFAAENIKWEFSDATDLGLTFSQPQIAPVSATQWAAIFGNGYNSTSEKAFLFIVDIATGTQIAKIATNNSTSNGLSTPYLLDTDGDKIVDVIYAGDLQGNLWKFDKSSGNWGLGNGGNPLFTASNASGDVQAITSQPKTAPHPDGGVMVYFGTGRYLTIGDLTNDDVQTVYGVWDKPATTGIVARADLLQQTILSTVTVAGTEARTVSTNTPTASNRGCYLDFPATVGSPSERIISSPLVKNFAGLDSRLIFTTATPNSDPCEKGGVSWVMELNLNCGRLSVSPFDINNDDEFDADDVIETVGADVRSASGLRLDSSIGITKTPLWLEGASGIAFKGFTGSTGATQTLEQSRDPDPVAGGGGTRIYWEQIL
jgi:type IV pilus assembly protein PilY1